MKTLIFILKGMLFGVANLIPGVSGGTLAVITGVFDKLLFSINNIFSKFKDSMKFLLPYVIGIFLGIFIGAIVIKHWKEAYPVSLEALFIGFIIGGIPFISKGIKKTDLNLGSIGIFLIAFMIVIILLVVTYMIKDNTVTEIVAKDYFMLFLCGFFGAVAMIIPGISGMMFFMLFGYYDVLLNILTNITDFSMLGENILIMLPIVFGILVGLFAAAKVFSKILSKYPLQSKFAIIGFIIASIISIVTDMVVNNVNGLYNTLLPEILISIFLVVLGFCITYFISKFSNNKNIEEETE